MSKVIDAFVGEWKSTPNPPRGLALYGDRMPLALDAAAHEERRGWLSVDWLARVCAPAWLELAGLGDDASALRALGALTESTMGAAMPALKRARTNAYNASNAAYSAAWNAADSAAWNAAYNAASEKAASAVLAPVVTALQASALDLLDRLILCGRDDTLSRAVLETPQGVQRDQSWLVLMDREREQGRLAWSI